MRWSWLVIFVLGACERKQAKPAAPPPSGVATVADGGTASVAADAAPGVDAISVDASAVAKTDVVFFLREAGQLLPLACFSSRAANLAGGSACAALVPDGASVRWQGGKPGKISGRDAANEDSPLFNVEAPPEGALFAVWPDTAALEVTPITSTRGSASDVRTASAALSQIGVRDDKPRVFTASVELDGGAPAERLLAVATGRKESSQVGALFRVDGATAVLLGRIGEDMEQATEMTLKLSGTLDLDGDGRPELWIVGSTEESWCAHVVRLQPKFAVIGTWCCSNSGTCGSV